MRRRFQIIPVFLLLILPVFAQQTDPSLLTVDSIFTYRTRSLGPVQWQTDGSGYLALEPSPTKKGSVDIVRYDLETHRVVDSFALPAEIGAMFLPPPVRVAPDGKKLYVLSQNVYVLDVETHEILETIDLTTPRSPGYGPGGIGFAPVEPSPGILYGFYRSPDPILKKTMFGITRVDLERREVESFDVSSDVKVEWFTVSPDGKHAYGGMGDMVAVDLETRKLLVRKENVEQGRQNTAMVVSSDGTKLFVGGVGPVIHVYDAKTLEPLRKIHAGGDVMNPPQAVPRSLFAN